MKRIYLILAAALAVLAVAAPATMAGSSTISVVFSPDYYSATITSEKGVSNYEYVLCDGTTKKVELGSGGGLLGFLLGGSSADQKSVKIGPFSSQIVSVRVKAGRDDLTFHSHYTGECGPPKEDPDPK